MQNLIAGYLPLAQYLHISIETCGSGVSEGVDQYERFIFGNKRSLLDSTGQKKLEEKISCCKIIVSTLSLIDALQLALPLRLRLRSI